MKQFKILLSLLLVLCVTFCLCACGGGNESTDDGPQTSDPANDGTEDSAPESGDTSDDTTEASPEFTVKVVDAAGVGVSGVMVQVCKDVCVPAMTNTEGVASFALEITDGYKLSVLSCPAGYEYTGEAEVYLDSGITEYTVELSEVQ